MARRRFARVRRYGRKVRHYRPKSIGVLAGVGLGVGLPLLKGAMDGYAQTKTLQGALINGVYCLTGYDANNGKFDSAQAAKGLGTAAVCIGGGWVLHKLASRTVNRYLPAGVKI